jgi:hypothetical protein
MERRASFFRRALHFNVGANCVRPRAIADRPYVPLDDGRRWFFVHRISPFPFLPPNNPGKTRATQCARRNFFAGRVIPFPNRPRREDEPKTVQRGKAKSTKHHGQFGVRNSVYKLSVPRRRAEDSAGSTARRSRQRHRQFRNGITFRRFAGRTPPPASNR